MQRQLPRWEKGSEIKADQLNQLAESIERIFGLGVGSGLEASDSLAGRIINAVQPRTGMYGKVAGGIISAAAGNKLGFGQVDLYYKDDAGYLQPYGGPSEDCFNLITSSIPNGKFIGLLWVEDHWSAVLEDCAQ